MVASLARFREHVSLDSNSLLAEGEVIVVVDDDPAIREPLATYLREQNFAVDVAENANELLQKLQHMSVALVLLDIGLPDIEGHVLLPQLTEEHPDLSIIMLTGMANLQLAMDCIRKGADDFLSKPVKFNEILFVVKKTLEKRRLIFENRKYQEELEEAHFRIQLLHQLSVKMNTVYLTTLELDEILQAILVGITANEGLRFNRAFLAMFNDDESVLEGRLAIGPDCRETAGELWNEIHAKEYHLLDMIKDAREHCRSDERAVNQIVKKMRVPATDTENILIKAAKERRSIKVSSENGCVPVPHERRGDIRDNIPTMSVPHELIELLGEDSFVLVPLFSPRRSFGVIIADNYVTRRPIQDEYIRALELFASQASLAIEQSHLYMDMQKQILELEALNREIDQNKDLLIKAERYTALGQMAAQMVHVLRNPITSIGGVSRILAKKIDDPEHEKYLNVMIKETDRMESTLEDLFDFVTQADFHKELASLYPIIRKTLLLMQSQITKQNIETILDLPDPDPLLEMDVRQIRQMFLHLVKNSVEAMTNGGTLNISASKSDGGVTVTLSDTGVGISNGNLAAAKDPFFTTKTYGTGMGLTMVERIIKGHGGSFELERLTAGIEVKVFLPLAGHHDPE
ncbi:MAG: response regulator [Desulfobulbaceae bacterium]|nr:response regulator [Desulfobulbaceae bacterium]